MYSNEKKINTLFFYWLVISLILVFFIIIVGGLTRLTNSGLSITEWELFKGILPPLSNESWNEYFDEYKKIPQYQLMNFDMDLKEFKIIFYWEYFHRILGRFIGIFRYFFLNTSFIFSLYQKNKKRLYINLLYNLLFNSGSGNYWLVYG